MQNEVDIQAPFIFVRDEAVEVFSVVKVSVCEAGAQWDVVTPCGDYLELVVPEMPPQPFVGTRAASYLNLARRQVAARLWSWAGERGRGACLSVVRC